MICDSNRLSRFWQELKRRKVIHVITVYASAAFVIIELINNLAEPLNLPPNLITIVVIVLAVGFPLAIILSWLYDLTPEGVEKTKPIGEVTEGEKTVVPNAWRIATYVSFVAIVGLLTFNIVGSSNLLHAGDIQSLLILPFDNLTGDDQLDWVASGMHSSLIGDMGQISGLRVISKTTASIYKDLEMSLPDIATELNADAVVEPTVMRYGDSVCIQIRIITLFPEEKVIWMAEYTEEKSQIENLYNQVTKQIANEVKVQLTTQEEHLLSESRTINSKAYDYYLKGQYYWEKLLADSLQLAHQYFESAIQIEPEWADPYVGLANTWGRYATAGLLPEAIAIPNQLRYLNKAMELNPKSAQAHYGKALYAVWGDMDWKMGEEEFLKSIELNPNDALARLYYAHLLMILRRSDEAVYQANFGLALDPLRPLVLGLYGVVMTVADDYEAAIAAFEKSKSIAPDFRFAFNILPALYKSGDYEGWIKYWEEKVRWNPDAKVKVVNAFHEKGHLAAVEEMFKMNEEYGDDIGQARMANSLKAQRSMYLNKPEEAVTYLSKMLDTQEEKINTTYIGTNLYFYDQLKDNPRYIDLLRKLNLPLPEKQRL